MTSEECDTAVTDFFNWIAAADLSVWARCRRLRLPAWLRFYFKVCGFAGDCWLWLLIGLIVAIVGRGPQAWRAIAAGAVAAFLGVAAFLLLKRAIRRRRPLGANPWSWDSFSFPSGHSVTAFGVSVALGSFYLDVLPVLLLAAVSVALSRITSGLHYLSDVVAGSVIGVCVGLVAVHVVERAFL